MNKIIHELNSKSTKRNEEKTFSSATYLNPNSIWLTKSPYAAVKAFFENLTPLQRMIACIYMDSLVNENWITIECSQDYFVRKLKIGSKTVQRAIQKLKFIDFIDNQNRQYQEDSHRATNRTWINEYFLRPEVIEVFKSVAYRMKYYCFRAFMVTSIVATGADDLQLNKGNICDEKIWAAVQLSYSQFMKPKTNQERYHLPGMVWDCNNKAEKLEFLGEAMNQDSLEFISNHLDSLPLTDRGMLKLSVFSLPVLEYLVKQPIDLRANDLFAYFFAIAKNRATELSETPDFTVYDKIVIEMKIGNKPYIDAEKFSELKERQQQSAKPKPSSDNSNWPTLDQQKQSIIKAAAAQGIPTEGLSFGEICRLKRMKYYEQIGAIVK